MKALILTATIIMIIFFPSCDNSVGPGGDNYHNKILFTSSRGGTPQLFMMNPDGTGIQQVTSGQYSHSNGRWSPDARQIVATTDENWSTDCYSKMVFMNSDGTNRHLLGCGSQMSWSPDGKLIAFMYWPGAEVGDLTTYIYIIDADGANPIKLTNNEGDWNGTPNWSPDGKLIAFGSSRDYPLSVTFTEIYLMNSDGSEIIILDSLSTGGLISWSPDGSRLVFGAGAVYSIKKDGTDVKKILTDSAVWGADWSR